MSAMGDLFCELIESLETKRYAHALELLEPWGDEAPAQLWGVMKAMAEDTTPPELPSHYLPRAIVDRVTTPADLRSMAKDLRAEGISGMNVALVLDLLARDYSRNWNEVN